MERRVPSKLPSKLNEQIYSEACQWFVECRTGNLDDATRREFDRWLRKSPEHLSAYLEIAAIWNEGPSLDPLHQWDTEKLIAEAVADHDNVIPLMRSSAERSETTVEGASTNGLADSEGALAALTIRYPLTANHFSLIAASIAIIAVMVGALVWSVLLHAPTYTTGIGEQRSVVLADGSTVELNSRSKVKVRYSKQERALELIEGQALFRVAKDHARPFVVTSDNTRVRAVGTQFDVYKKRSGTVVTVVEGRVAILTSAVEPDLAIAADPAALSMPPSPVEIEEHGAEQGGAGAGVYLSAGEQATVTHEAVRESSQPNIASAIAWRQRQLVFEAASLAEVAEEFNRYNERQLVVRDRDLYDFHISGVFSSTDPASLIRFLRERPGVQIIETASEIQVAKKIHEEVTDR